MAPLLRVGGWEPGPLLGSWWVNPVSPWCGSRGGSGPEDAVGGCRGNSGGSKLFTREESVGAVVSQLQDRQENDPLGVWVLSNETQEWQAQARKRRGWFPITKGEAEDRWARYPWGGGPHASGDSRESFGGHDHGKYLELQVWGSLKTWTRWRQGNLGWTRYFDAQSGRRREDQKSVFSFSNGKINA